MAFASFKDMGLLVIPIFPIPADFYPNLPVKCASAGGEPAEAFAKGGDSEEHLGGVLFSLRNNNSAQVNLCISSNVTYYM